MSAERVRRAGSRAFSLAERPTKDDYDVDNGAACFAVTGQLAPGTPVWRQSSDGCVPAPLNPRVPLLEVGNEVPPTTFAEVRRVIE